MGARVQGGQGRQGRQGRQGSNISTLSTSTQHSPQPCLPCLIKLPTPHSPHAPYFRPRHSLGVRDAERKIRKTAMGSAKGDSQNNQPPLAIWRL